MNQVIPADPPIALTEPEVEGIVLGSLMCHPDALAALASEINADWFTDPAARMFVEAALRLHGEGHKVTGPLLAASVSPAADSDGMTRSTFLAHVAASAMPLAYLGGYIQTLRDRWARRLMVTEAVIMQQEAQSSLCDPFETAGASISALDTIGSSRGPSSSSTLGASVDQLFENIRNPISSRLVTTGLRAVDAALNGYSPGKLYVVAGRPGMGKSAFACSSLRRTAEAGGGVSIYSLEMGHDEISARCLSDAIDSVKGPFFGTILKQAFTVADGDLMGEARQLLVSLPMRVDTSPSLTFSQIAARARKDKARFEAAGRRLDVLCIDHMGLVRPSDRYKGSKVAEVGEVSSASKALAKELNCCVVLLCQLSRQVEGRDDKRPTLADLRWSGDIEQDADVVAFIYREHYYLAQQPDCDPDQLHRARHRLEFLIRKNRNGETRDVPLWCSIGHSSIRDAA